MSRLSIDLTEQQHKSLKAIAALQGKTIRQYAVERLFPAEPGEEGAWDQLRDLLNARMDGPLSTKNVDDILREELGGEYPA
ncbi:MAG: antitoxin [Novosphingobium sp.]|jgi:hypothetical protein|uniref:antitoxin n=1 Tax=Novosphingobium sp. TaxID=1874826 RepID=UPI003018358A